jgi:hypothetical protein
MTIKPLKEILQDIKAVSGVTQREGREEALKNTASLLRSCSAIVAQSAQYYSKQNAQLAAQHDPTRVKGYNMPYIPPIPAEKDLKLTLEAQARDKMPLQVHLLGTLSRAVNNASVGLNMSADPMSQKQAEHGFRHAEDISSIEALMQMRLTGLWRPGLTYEEWWSQAIKSLTEHDKQGIDEKMTGAWAFMRQHLPVGPDGPFKPDDKTLLIAAFNRANCQLNNTNPVMIEHGKLSQFLEKYENPVSLMAGAAAGIFSTGFIMAMSGKTVESARFALGAGFSIGLATTAGVKKSIKTARENFKGVDR